MKFTTLIPLRYNDGREVPQEVIEGIFEELFVQFQGYSEEGITKGMWADPMNAKIFRDESRRISINCDKSLLWKAQQAVIKIGKVLQQRAMYFEVRDYDAVQILEIRTDESSSTGET